MTEPTTPPPPDASANRGLKAVTGEEFKLAEALGGARGVIETAAPGILFVTVWVTTNSLPWSLISACAVALIAVVARLVQRTPLTQALSGLAGIGLGVFMAWRTGEAGDFFLPGLWINGAYLVGILLTVAVRWPFVGVMVELLRLGFTAEKAQSSGEEVNPFKGFTAWRKNRNLMKRYDIASWLWAAMFALRLAVQWPLFAAGEDYVGALGIARLVMGTPLWALVLWLTWMLVRGAHGAPSAVEQNPGPDVQ
ncbi:MAG: DUF3159 domain-containing protein [Promicromonosporaceae bacterium]|nr:DUF3159 domain-containing protein [Promicromonosporaceae bacterium]